MQILIVIIIIIIIIKEAHRIKNKRTVLHERLKKLKFNHNIFLTGNIFDLLKYRKINSNK